MALKRTLGLAVALIALLQTAEAQFGPPSPPVEPRDPCAGGKKCDCAWEAVAGTRSCVTTPQSKCVNNQIKGTFEVQVVITRAAANGGTCPLKPGAKKGDKFKKEDGSCTKACGSTDPCMPGGKPYCQNKGVCDKGTQPPTCRCTALFDGAKCENAAAAGKYCKGDPCQKRGTCIHLKGVNTCVNCTGNWDGPHCAVDVCNNQGPKCKNNGKCVVTKLKTAKSAACDCTGTGYVGADCTVKSGSTGDLCKKLGCLQGKCVVNTQFASARCICKKGWSGEKCDKNGQQTSDCDSVGTMNCVLGVTTVADPASNDGKCQAYKEYAKCAEKYKCPGMLASWCQLYFKPAFGYCTLTACSAQKSTCKMDIYQACFVKFKKDVVDKSPQGYLDPCTTAKNLAQCALNASCFDIASVYCSFRNKQNKGRGCHDLPKECENYKEEASEADFAMTSSDFTYHGIDSVSQKKAAEKATYKGGMVVTVAVIFAGVAIAVAILLVRRRSGQSAPTEDSAQYQEL